MDTNININIEDIYYKKYIKYKTKYLELKEQSGGVKISPRSFRREENNDIYLLPIEIIYSLLKKILDIFIPEDIPEIIPQDKLPDKSKNLFSFFKKTKIVEPKIIKKPQIEKQKIEKPQIEEEIINIFKSIKKVLEESYKKYNSFYDYMSYGTQDTHEYCTVYIPNLQLDMNNKQNDIIISIQKIKNNHEELGKIIIDQINLYLSKQYKNELRTLLFNYDDFSKNYDNELKLFFPSENYKYGINGFNNLEYILKYYFYKINIGIEKSYPRIRKGNTDSSKCLYDSTINIIAPIPPPSPLITKDTVSLINNSQDPPIHLSSYYKTIEMRRSLQQPTTGLAHLQKNTSTAPTPPPRSSITQLAHQTVPATAHQTAQIPAINHSQVRISRPLNNIVHPPLNNKNTGSHPPITPLTPPTPPDPPPRKAQTPPAPPPRKAQTPPDPPPRKAQTPPAPPPRKAPT
jgi:hypothetical protein